MRHAAAPVPPPSTEADTINSVAPKCTSTPDEPAVNEASSSSSSPRRLDSRSSAAALLSSLDLLALAVFVCINFANWRCCHCVDGATRKVDTNASATLQLLWAQMSAVNWTRPPLELAHSQLADGEFYEDIERQVIDTPAGVSSPSRVPSKSARSPFGHKSIYSKLSSYPAEWSSNGPDCKLTPCTSSSSDHDDRAESGWSLGKRRAETTIMKREVYPLPRKSINETSFHQQHHLGLRGGNRRHAADDSADNDTTISRASINGKQEEHTALSLTTPTSFPIQSINAHHHGSASEEPPSIRNPPASPPSFVNRFKTSNVFEAAAKQQQQERAPSYLTHNSSHGSGGVVSLLGLFELSTKNDSVRPEGHSELAAARLAVRHINAQHLLPGYRLELVTNDTKVRGRGAGSSLGCYILICLANILSSGGRFVGCCCLVLKCVFLRLLCKEVRQLIGQNVVCTGRTCIMSTRFMCL